MKPAKLYEIFTEALSNDNIKAELIEILALKADEDRIEGQTELFDNADASALSAENAELSRRAALLELELGRLESENASLVSQLKRCKDSLDEYCSAYAMQITMYEKYKSLSADTMQEVRGFFKNSTLSGFFICGVQIDNLRGLRDYTERLIIEKYEERKGDIAVLNELYTYLLSCYNSTFNAPVYRMTEAASGDEFDERIHHCKGTARSGKISSVLMQGCIATANSRVIRKAVVTVDS